MNFKVTLIQCNMNIGEENYNLRKMKKYLTKAVEANTDLVVLPETWLTGFGKKIFENINIYAKKENNEILQYLKDFAFDKDLHIVGGTILEKERDGNIYNNLYYINRNGIVEGKYSKMHLYSPGGEHKVVTPGHDISFVETEFGKFGFMICYDIRFPELARLYAQKEIDVLYVVANFNDPKKDQWLNLLKTRALENQCYVVACNRSGEKYFGNSVIVNPEGDIQLNAGRREGIYSGYVDLSLIKAVRKEFPYLEDIRNDIYNLKLNK